MAFREAFDPEKHPELALLAQRVKQAREELGLSQTELGERVGTSQAYIGHLERMRHNPGFLTLVLLAKELKKPLSFFVM